LLQKWQKLLFEPDSPEHINTTESWNLVLAFCNLVNFWPSAKLRCRTDFEISEIGLGVCLGVLVMWR